MPDDRGTPEGGKHTTPTADEDEEATPDSLDDVEDGCGCAEVWEHLSEQREADE